MIRIYIVTANRNNSVETVLTVTPNLDKAQLIYLRFLKDVGREDMAKELLQLFADRVLVDDAKTLLDDGLVLQLTTYLPTNVDS